MKQSLRQYLESGPCPEVNQEMLSQLDLLEDEKARLSTMADRLLAHLDDGTHESGGECSVCSTICCPHGDLLHFHHDGCPSCYRPTNKQ